VLRVLAMPPSALFPGPTRLIADDQVLVRRDGGGLWMAAPPALEGKLEVRGIGIVALDPAMVAHQPVRLALVVDLAPERDSVERLPEAAEVEIAGASVPALRLYPFDASAALKLGLAVAAIEQ